MSRLNEAKTALEQYEQTKPGAYQSQYKPKIDNVLGKLEDMGEFDYDPDADTAYKQYKDQYTRQAQKDNENAQASAAALTGGYANSYGTQAGQTAYASTMDRLDSVLDGCTTRALGSTTPKRTGCRASFRACSRRRTARTTPTSRT